MIEGTSDIHGEYDKFMELLDKIKLKETDTLYILGDILDRGPHPIKTLRKLMDMPNVICMVGNHELMALDCLEFLMKEITDMSIEKLDEDMLDNLVTWQYNGSKSTIDEFCQLDVKAKQEVIEFIKDFVVYEEVSVNDKDYLFVHAGLGNYSPEKEIEDYSLHELLWMRADYDVQYFEHTYVVTGHTPTQTIEGNPHPGYIYQKNHHIAIDCGAHYPGGRLAVTFPKSVGQIPFAFPFKPGSDVPASTSVYGALYPFGYGLSYTSFVYSDLQITPKEQGVQGEVNISCRVKNTGKVKGDEVVQLYLRDEVSSVTTYTKVLRGFERISLEPGEEKIVHFKLRPQDLGLWDKNMNFCVEPGSFKVMVGASSADIRLKGSFEII